MRDIILIDLSSIAHPIWHMSGAEPDPNAASQKIVARVRSIATDQPHVAVCCDKGKSFRHDITPTYKANRPESDATLRHQIQLAVEILQADGFPVWAVPGFEADDLIASATVQALNDEETTVAIFSADKDLLQLVGERVRQVSTINGVVYDAAGVREKFGVSPSEMRDYLTLVGDAADNVRGAKGIGAKTAAELLERFGSIDNLYRDMREVGVVSLKFTPSRVTALREFEPLYPQTRELITLRTDVDLPFAQLFDTRTPKDAGTFGMDEDTTMDTKDETMPMPTAPPPMTKFAEQAPAPVETAAPVKAIATRSEVLPAPAEWERGLEPRSMTELITLAKCLFESRLFSAYGTPQAVLSTLLAGRELGMQSMAAMRAIHIIEGKPTLSADLIRGLILRSGKAKYFRCTERSATSATFVTKRIGDPEMSLTYTIEEATAAGLVKEKSGWVKNPADMLVARAGSKLARLAYPDVVHGIYTREEIEEGREVAA